MTTTYSRSVFVVPKMDCPAEERLVRLALDGLEVRSLEFDLPTRRVTVAHSGAAPLLLSRLDVLNLGARLESSEPAHDLEQSGENLWLSTFSVSGMDCAAEERLIRMKLDDAPGVVSLSFDLPERQLGIVHRGTAKPVLERLASLNLGAVLLATHPHDEAAEPVADAGNDRERRTLQAVLGINAAMFVFELALGIVAHSTGLIADSLDMFADAAVYGLALYAVGRAAHTKARAAHLAGWLQLLLALGVLFEVIRRFVYGSEPEPTLMWAVGLIALAANVTCLVLVARQRDRGAHMKASYIFSANDVIANLGVIAAGVLVGVTGSSYPDLIIGTIIGLIVLNGARRILQLK
ncbi:MAG: cation transporter [Burkholderiaceae bacterium]|jgi:hypothetical protein|nr:cation transporter [Burkholderiaceae bacterium]